MNGCKLLKISMKTRYKQTKGQETKAESAKRVESEDVVPREVGFSVLLKLEIGKKEIK